MNAAALLGVISLFLGSDGRAHAAYELRVDAGPVAVNVERVEVFDEASTLPLLAYAGDELDSRVMRPGAARDVRYGRRVGAGATAIIHLWLTLPAGRAAPRHLRHVITATAEDGSRIAVDDVRVDIQPASPIVLGPPLRRGIWLVHNGAGAHQSPHWGSVLDRAGRTTIPQRFAIDFIGVDDRRRAVKGDFQKSANADWVGFNAEVIAVADGVVQAVRDGLGDNVPLVEPPPPQEVTLTAVGGDYVVLQLDANTFVEYVHLRRGSVAVKVGQRVRRGDVLGRLGNSGNTNAPHLHFGVESAAQLEDSEGLPFVIDSFELLGATTADQVVGAEPPSTAAAPPPSKRSRELPLHEAVVRFR